MTAKKFDQEKPDLSLIAYCAEVALARAMMYGAKKYGRYNYTKGHKVSQLVAAMKRHISLYMNGEEADTESGVHHLGHVMANCMMILHQTELGTSTDDRHKPTPTSAPGPYQVWVTRPAGDLWLETFDSLKAAMEFQAEAIKKLGDSVYIREVSNETERTA